MVTFTSAKGKYAYSDGSYKITNNAWGAGKLVEGSDYSMAVTFDPNNFQAGALFAWKFPKSVGGVYAYPHVEYLGKISEINSVEVAKIEDWSASFNVDLTNKVDSTVAFDLWFNSKPNGAWATTNAELLIEVVPASAGKPNQPYFISGLGFTDATVHVSNMSAAGANWKFIDVKLRKPLMSGTISISDIVKGLIERGEMTGREYLGSLQFGSEIHGGTGGLKINSLRYDWKQVSLSRGAADSK